MTISPLPPPRDWAVLIYSSASPDIEQAAVQSLEEVRSAQVADSVSVGVQLGTRDGVVRYVGGEAAAPQQLPPTDMARGDSLADFLRWGMQRLPARHYMVVLGGHGSGYLGAVTDAARSHMIPPADIARALDAAPAHADVVVANACFMAQVEVAAELEGHTPWLVASQGMEEKEGLPLGRLLERLPGASPREAALALVDEAAQVPTRTPFVSLLDLSATRPVVQALDRLGRAILETPASLPCVREHVEALPTFRKGGHYDPPLSDFKDLAALARGLEADPRLRDTPLPEAARACREAAQGLVVAHTPGDATHPAAGVSVYAPLVPLENAAGSLGARAWESYGALVFARGSHWDEAVSLLVGRPPG